MKPRHKHVCDALAAAVARFDVVLCPWGFTFLTDEVHDSHCGPFASGHYCRDTTRIGLSCRDSIDNVYYEHSFVKENRFSKEIERFVISHRALMKALDHSDDCRLVCGQKIPEAIVARDGGDCVAALIYDLSSIAVTVLQEPCDKFYEIMRCGSRTYSVI